MKGKIKNFAGEAGLGIGSVYAFFLIPNIYELFSPEAVIVIRQVLVISFAFCILVNPKGLIEVGETFAPKLIKVLTLIFNNKKNEN